MILNLCGIRYHHHVKLAHVTCHSHLLEFSESLLHLSRLADDFHALSGVEVDWLHLKAGALEPLRLHIHDRHCKTVYNATDNHSQCMLSLKPTLDQARTLAIGEFARATCIAGKTFAVTRLFDRGEYEVFLLAGRINIKSPEKSENLERALRILRELLPILRKRFQCEAAETALGTTSQVRRVCMFLSQNFQNDCSLKTIAKSIGVSPDWISRHFKAQTGQTLPHYVNSLRITHAEQLLTNPHLAITEIAFRCGFQSLSTFHRAFTEHNKHSATDYRDSFTAEQDHSIELKHR